MMLKARNMQLSSMNQLTSPSKSILCILVSYFSEKRNEMITAFLSLIPVLEATGEIVFNLIEKEITSSNQCLEKCIGFASELQRWLVATILCDLGWKKCPHNVCNSNVPETHLHYAFSTQFLNCHQTLDFCFQKYHDGFVTVS